MQLAASCRLLDSGVDTVRFTEPFRLLVFERRRTLMGAVLVQGTNHGSEPGEHLAELKAHQNLYAQQAGMQRGLFARINAVCAHMAFMAVAPASRGQGIGRQLVRAAASVERQRGRRMLTGFVWDDDLARMYERWGFIVSPPEAAAFFLREKVGTLYAPSSVGLSLKEGSRMIVLPPVPEVRTYDLGTADQPFPAVVGVEEPFDPTQVDMPEEINEVRKRVDAFVQKQMTLDGPERTRAMFDAHLGQSRD
ncbi:MULTISPECIES: GNAT family N-acetyltransferase [unclassified Streptomyces]|uniref:GNAT family N-acetyltransferase n=1 Tax=unclassified Streptomyces TaxID=2593676 RepID=UPI002E81ACA7|nr:GNAT family N-acetyltransferase [Streptomyces sp. NBC_00562]WUC24953.1 GNAT family N-acetyltransferase [Streptomyces sp. NBC_00562]